MSVAHLFTKTERTDAFWRAYTAGGNVDDDYEVVALGSSTTMADALCDLVLSGPKRATAGLWRDFVGGGEAAPRIGGHVVLVDGSGSPRAVWRTVELRLGRLDSVDEAFAWDEGEGDRTRADWLDGHRRFFTAQAEAEGFEMHDGIETVFERFRVVWPPELADQPLAAA